MKYIFTTAFLLLFSTTITAWEEALRIPPRDLNAVDKVYSTQNGLCTVWVTEKLNPGTPIVGDNKIIYPYHCDRPNHKYKCGNGPVEGPVNASYRNKVTAEYTVVGGLPKFSNYTNPGDNAEASCGAIIINHLKILSSN